MKHMVSIRFTPGHQAEIAALTPQERAHIAELRTQGIVESLYLSYENGGLVWIVMNGDSKEAVQKALEAFPMYPFMVAEIAALT